MRVKLTAIWILFAPLLILAYQNCSRSSFDSTTSASQRETDQPSNSGQPYDGKAYVVHGNCVDGTQIESRILLKSAYEGHLIRDNCQTIAPVRLGENEFDLHSSNATLSYQAKEFVLETPPVNVPKQASFFVQFQGALKNYAVDFYVVDLFDYSASEIAGLRTNGRTVLCHISAGIYENWRSDRDRFAASDLGSSLNSSERWIDTRSANVRSIMLERVGLASQKGCQGVYLTNIDGYAKSSGFPLTSESQIDFNRFLAFAARDRRLLVAQSQAPEIVPSLTDAFDLAIVGQCFSEGNCGSYQPYVARGKPVFVFEYSARSEDQCRVANTLSITLSYTNAAHDGSRYETCQ